MGVIRRVKCNMCGATWDSFEGVGFNGEVQGANQDKICPVCGSEDIVEDNEIRALWD